MGTFSTAFRKAITGKCYDNSTTFRGTSCSMIMGAANRFKNLLQSNIGRNDSFICALTCAADLIKDDIVLNDTCSYNSTIDDFSVIPDEVAELLIDGLDDAVTNGGLDEFSTGLVLTDSKNRAYNIVKQQDADIDGYDILYSSTVYVSRLSEGVILYKDGVYYLNNFIRTCDFAKQGASRVIPDTIQDILMSCCVIIGETYIYDDIFSLLSTIYGDSIADDIYSSFSLLAQKYDYEDHATTIYGKAVLLWHALDEAYPVFQGSGSIQCLWNIVKDQIESSALNEAMYAALQAGLANINDPAAFANVMQDNLQSKFKTVQQFTKDALQALSYGGIYGLCCYVLNYAKQLCTVQEDDGLLKFSDNSRLIPKIYIAGILSVVVTALSTIASIIVSIFSKVIGAAIYLVGSLTSSLIQNINVDEQRERASINNNVDVINEASPYGILQKELSISDIENSDLLSLISQGNSIGMFDIPGGVFFYGPGSFDDDGNIASIRFELHPSCSSNHACFTQVCHELADNDKILISLPDGYLYDGEVGTVKLDNIRPGENKTLAIFISEQWNLNFDEKIWFNDGDDGLHVNATTDADLRKVIMENAFIACLYVSLLGNLSIINDVAYGKFTATAFGADPIYVAQPNNNSGVWHAFLRWCPSFLYDDGQGHYMDVGDTQIVSRLPLGWDDIVSKFIDLYANFSHTYSLSVILGEEFYAGELQPINSTISYILVPAEYVQGTVWLNAMVTAIVVTIVAITAVAATIKIKSTLNERRALNQAQVQSAHQNFVNEPSHENYVTFKQAARKNNLYCDLIGGTKYDYVNYWSTPTDTSTAKGQLTGAVYSYLADSGYIGTNTKSENALYSAETYPGLNDIISLIRGY